MYLLVFTRPFDLVYLADNIVGCVVYSASPVVASQELFPGATRLEIKKVLPQPSWPEKDFNIL
jgi:hypothetical protein